MNASDAGAKVDTVTKSTEEIWSAKDRVSVVGKSVRNSRTINSQVGPWGQF